MSGGHWDYLSQQLEDRSVLGNVWDLLAAIEHEMDWGLCGDTCKKCAYIRVPLALEAFFDSQAREVKTAISIVRDRQQYLCDDCKKYKPTPPQKEPTL